MIRPLQKPWSMLIGAVMLMSWMVLMPPSPVHAQSCTPTIEAFYNATTNVCRRIGLGEACYGSDWVNATPSNLRFNTQGKLVGIAALSNIQTQATTGSVLMYARSNAQPVKIIAFGNTSSNAQGTSGQVFTLRPGASGNVCQSTKSGMLLQSPQQGNLTINGVQIELGSTAFVSVDGGVLYDQNPRYQRRPGQRNPDAPLCSGFDSDCDFGDRRCANKGRLVWGPFCQAGSYPYIRNGLYRVSLFGEGNVLAGATEYGSHSGAHFAFGRYDLTLPASYTFCWPGQGPGGQGFETIVQSKGGYARVDHITLEYLGANCSRTNVAPSEQYAVMTVTNVEGRVSVSAAGARRDLRPGDQARVLLNDLRPVKLSGPMPADEVMNSPVINWLTWDPNGLPIVNEEDAQPPVVFISQANGQFGYPPADGLMFQVIAYDPAFEDSDGAGIDHVNLEVRDPNGKVVVSTRQGNSPYCAFDDDGETCNVWYYNEHDYRWPNQEGIQSNTTYTLWAEAVSTRGKRASVSMAVQLWKEVIIR